MQQQQRQRQQQQLITKRNEAIVSVVVVVVIGWNTPKSIIGTVNHHNFSIMHILLSIRNIVSIPFYFECITNTVDERPTMMTTTTTTNLCACCMFNGKKLDHRTRSIRNRTRIHTEPDKRMTRASKSTRQRQREWARNSLHETEMIIIKRAYHSTETTHRHINRPVLLCSCTLARHIHLFVIKSTRLLVVVVCDAVPVPHHHLVHREKIE